MGLLNHGQIEMLRDPRPSGLPQAATQGWVAEQALDRGCEALRIARRNQQSSVSVNHGLGHAADVGGDNGKAGGHRLEDRERKPLGLARKDEEVGCGEQLGNVITLAGELDGGLESEEPNLLLHGGPIRPVADELRLSGLQRPGRPPDRRRCG
jgi:hypothetical protein